MSLATIVKGNTFSLAIPLQVYAVEDGEVVLRDYTPESGDNITIRLKGDRRNYTYIPATNGNTAFVHLEGSEVVGVYAVEVEIVKDDDSKLTSMRFEQLSIVETIEELNDGQITEGIEQGAIYLDPEIFIAGKDGRGIVSIIKTATVGLVDTYTITYTDNTTSTFNVTNGANGINGQDGADGEDGVGIASIAKTGTQGLVDTYTITMTNGTTYTYQVTNGKNGEDGEQGEQGEAGVGIVSITKTSTSGLVDTYTILLTNGTSTTFTVTNGRNGTNGQDGEDGVGVQSITQTGTSTESGGVNTITCVLTNGTTTTFSIRNGQQGAQGEKGDTGEKGEKGDTGESGQVPLVDVNNTASHSQSLDANKFYRFLNAITSLSVTLGTGTTGIANIYAFSFTAGQDAPNITLPQGVQIADAPTINNGDYVEFSIMDGKALAKVWSA